MPEDFKSKLEMLRKALCEIEVHGESNLNRLLGSIQFIDKLIEDVRSNEPES